jgi:hypothetical protein
MPFEADRLLDQVGATWLTLESCRSKVDDDARTLIDDALAALDEVAAVARKLRLRSADAATSWPGVLREVDELASAIYEHVRDAAP